MSRRGNSSKYETRRPALYERGRETGSGAYLTQMSARTGASGKPTAVGPPEVVTQGQHTTPSSSTVEGTWFVVEVSTVGLVNGEIRLLAAATESAQMGKASLSILKRTVAQASARQTNPLNLAVIRHQRTTRISFASRYECRARWDRFVTKDNVVSSQSFTGDPPIMILKGRGEKMT